MATENNPIIKYYAWPEYVTQLRNELLRLQNWCISSLRRVICLAFTVLTNSNWRTYWPCAPDFNLALVAFKYLTVIDVFVAKCWWLLLFLQFLPYLSGYSLRISQMLHTRKQITGVFIKCIRLLLSTSGAIPKWQELLFPAQLHSWWMLCDEGH